ncbi:MAG: hypothetical protein N838_06270 [Thiohalocapsa sp. PB-PSB1]|nr:MAG: hypothetical protein N838_06270 [Thiohalocapsa sp. PB-PSB1]
MSPADSFATAIGVGIGIGINVGIGVGIELTNPLSAKLLADRLATLSELRVLFKGYYFRGEIGWAGCFSSLAIHLRGIPAAPGL